MIQGKLDDIIQSFCGDGDDLRPKIMTPQFEPDTKLVIATDAHILIIAPDKYFDGKYEHHVYVDWRAVLPAGSESPLFKLKTHDILAEIALIPLEDLYDDCLTCGGSGEHDCICGCEHECGVCDGTGEGKNIIGTQLAPDVRFKIKGIAFSTRLINKIAQAAQRLSIDEICIHNFAPMKPMLCLLGDVKIMVMPISEIDRNCAHIELTEYYG